MSPASRYDRYVQVWHQIVERADLPNGGTSDDQIKLIQQQFGLETFRGAIHEIVDLIDIFRVFKDTDQIPKELLEKIVGGKDCEIEEERKKPHTSQPRNFLFELSVAAALKKRGFSVTVGDQADAVFNFRNHRVFVECKRLFSEESFERNILKASNQLLSRYSSFGLPVNLIGQIPLGIAVFSVGKIINPQQNHLRARSPETAVDILDQRINQLWKRRRSLILLRSHANTIATGFFIRTPISVPEGFGTLRRWRFFLHYGAPHKLADVSNQIKRKLTGV